MKWTSVEMALLHHNFAFKKRSFRFVDESWSNIMQCTLKNRDYSHFWNLNDLRNPNLPSIYLIWIYVIIAIKVVPTGILFAPHTNKPGSFVFCCFCHAHGKGQQNKGQQKAANKGVGSDVTECVAWFNGIHPMKKIVDKDDSCMLRNESLGIMGVFICKKWNSPFLRTDGQNLSLHLLSVLLSTRDKTRLWEEMSVLNEEIENLFSSSWCLLERNRLNLSLSNDVSFM